MTEERSATTGDIDVLDILLGAGSLVHEVRYSFEQRRFPEIVFEHEDEFIDLIASENIEELERIIREDWYFVSASIIAIYLIDLGEGYSLDDISNLMGSVSQKRAEVGLGEKHIASVTLEQIGDSISAAIIEMYHVRLPMISSFIAIVYSKDAGINYFTLERSFDFLGTGDAPYMFCFVEPSGRGNFGVIENSREAFINAIRAVMSN